MERRILGRTGREVSVIGLGTWQLGGDWGDVENDTARQILQAAVDSGVTFLDTADVYGDGRSERLIGAFLTSLDPAVRSEIVVATKMGRRAPQDPGEFTADNFKRWNDRSRELLGVDTLDLVQLHCPPDPVFDRDGVFDALDAMVEEGRCHAYGVSVETCDQALRAIARPHVASIQVILNPFRLKPLADVVPAAREAGVGIIARVPLASGLLSGRFGPTTRFSPGDHRSYNRHGEAFDVGETFSGVPFDVGVEAAREFAAFLPATMTPAQGALRWVSQQAGVSTTIPGATTPDQARANAAAGKLPPLDEETMRHIEDLYDRRVRGLVHHRW